MLTDVPIANDVGKSAPGWSRNYRCGSFVQLIHWVLMARSKGLAFLKRKPSRLQFPAGFVRAFATFLAGVFVFFPCLFILSPIFRT